MHFGTHGHGNVRAFVQQDDSGGMDMHGGLSPFYQ